VRQVYLEVKLRQAFALAHEGRKAEAEALAAAFGQPASGFDFTKDGMTAFVDAPRFQYYCGELEPCSGTMLLPAGTGCGRPQAATFRQAAFAYRSAQRLGEASDAEWRPRLQAALHEADTYSSAGPLSRGRHLRRGLLLRALGRTREATRPCARCSFFRTRACLTTSLASRSRSHRRRRGVMKRVAAPAGLLVLMLAGAGRVRPAPRPRPRPRRAPDQILLKDFKPVSLHNVPVTTVPKPATPRSTCIPCLREDPRGRGPVVKVMDDAGVEKTCSSRGRRGGLRPGRGALLAAPHRFELWCGLDYAGHDQPGYGPPPSRARALRRKGARGVGEEGDKGLGMDFGRRRACTSTTRRSRRFSTAAPTSAWP